MAKSPKKAQAAKKPGKSDTKGGKPAPMKGAKPPGKAARKRGV